MTAGVRLSSVVKALGELGPGPLILYARYRLGLRSGYLRWRTARPPAVNGREAFVHSASLPTLPGQRALAACLGDSGQADLLSAADEIVAGRVRLFGGQPRPLVLDTPSPLRHWTAYEAGEAAWGGADPRVVWEPGRCGWAVILARAYHLSGEHRFARAFWDHTGQFLDANPPYLGPHWVSAQEAALRLVALAFAVRVFAADGETTPARMERLGRALAAHAARIPPTLVYARAQGNNHLLSEAAGLYTAGAVLPEHREAGRWRALGWRWFNQAVQDQIQPDGTYTQHSSNYHRLMLQAALWVAALAEAQGQELPLESRRKLAAAARWALALLDKDSGGMPNLGPNDGAYILPLAACPFADYRPVVQAAALAFLDERPLPQGPWDEMALWLAPQAAGEEHPASPSIAGAVAGSQVQRVLRPPGSPAWGYLRVAQFRGRPGHADQLHLDLWWRGQNIALDPGTYRYTAAPPWDNALAGSAAHNTVTVDSRDQMTRAGRFLWLDRAQGKLVAQAGVPGAGRESVTASHDGYRRLGVTHQRVVSAGQDGRWEVRDLVLPVRSRVSRLDHTVRLHWLLPDWPWELDGTRLRLQSVHGWVTLEVSFEPPGSDERGLAADLPDPVVRLARAGESLAGPGPVSPTWGWFAPTYDHKVPALSWSVTVRGYLPVICLTQWDFP